MVASLIARSVTVTRGRRTILDSVDVTLAPGHRVGLVGPNGVGKSTLLAALAGELAPDEGRVELHPPDATVGWLRQETATPLDGRDETVVEQLARRTGVTAAQQELDAATVALADRVPGADDRYERAWNRWMSLGAADLDARIGVVCAELGLDERLLAAPVVSLSGGERARCSLAVLLLSRHDIVLLDEPTNDLDLDGLGRLEAWTLGRAAPMMIVSHDRSFLERVATDVVEIDHHTHRATWFAGGWAAFLAERALARQHAQARYDEYDAKRATLRQRAQREREWATQGQARVRRSGETDKYIRHFKVNQTEQLAGKAARTERAIERLDVVEEPRDRWELRLTIPSGERSGDRVAWAHEAWVDRGSFRLGPVEVVVDAGDRVVIVGPNGSGKSTLIGLLTGAVAPTSGTAGIGRGVRLGGIDQARALLDAGGTLVSTLTRATGMTTVDARTLLAKFELRADDVERPAASLSPGERTRALMALLAASSANLLVLDEPTNHLDLEAIEQLEAAVDAYKGTVLLVSHDRTFLGRFRATRTITVADGRCTVT
jgi:ATPase subunit of ABC transporter with duplicated ATPase domains